MRKWRVIGAVAITWLTAATVSFAGEGAAGDVPALFAEQRPLELTLTADFKRLLSRKRWSGDRWYDGRITLPSPDGGQRSLEVRLKLRGGFRTQDDTCYFPQLFVDFAMADTAGTVFSGQRVLALTTHCRGSSAYSAYIYRELMAYRLYNLFTEKSLRPRAALITYVRSDKPVVVARRYAFFVEHFDDMAERLQAEVVEIEGFHPLVADHFEMGVLDMFQFMVGNTDWSAAFQHNIVLLKDRQGRITAVPYDFDFSGLVNARYAAPAKQFRERSVRVRIYRGYCRDESEVRKVVDYFRSMRPQVFERINGFDWIPEPVLKDAARYIESFYDVLNDPGEFREQVLEECGRGTPVRSKSRE